MAMRDGKRKKEEKMTTSGNTEACH